MKGKTLYLLEFHISSGLKVTPYEVTHLEEVDFGLDQIHVKSVKTSFSVDFLDKVDWDLGKNYSMFTLDLESGRKVFKNTISDHLKNPLKEVNRNLKKLDQYFS